MSRNSFSCLVLTIVIVQKLRSTSRQHMYNDLDNEGDFNRVLNIILLSCFLKSLVVVY